MSNHMVQIFTYTYYSIRRDTSNGSDRVDLIYLVNRTWTTGFDVMSQVGEEKKSLFIKVWKLSCENRKEKAQIRQYLPTLNLEQYI